MGSTKTNVRIINMTRLIFATNNQHKVEEIQAAIGHLLKVVSLKEAGIEQEVPEPFETLEENAREKARVINRITGENCFSEDTGLEVEALDGAPGVRSARFAGEDANAEKNTEKLLKEMESTGNRKARFRTVICLKYEGKEYLFEGICEGRLLAEKRGSLGFGYDPVFVPGGAEKTFAEMNMEEKNRFSHRQKAASQLVLFLQQQLVKP